MSDSQARNEIISNVNKNYFVEAGAGSGKTTILVERMVAMVERGFPVDQICTITFTKAAANEFYARFQKRLSERSRDENKESNHPGKLLKQTEETKKNCAIALQNIDSCFMGTIDSFCNMILSEHPLEAGIPANSTVVEEEKIVERYVKEYSRIKTEEAYAGLRDKYEVFVNTQGNALRVFKAVLSSIIQIRNAEFIYEKPEYFSIEEKYRSEKADLVKLFNRLIDNKSLAYVKKSGTVDEAWDVLEQKKVALTMDNWDDNFPSVLDALVGLKKDKKELRLRPVDNLEDYLGSSAFRFTDHYTGKKLSWYELNTEFKSFVDQLRDYQARIALDFTVECVKVMSQVLRKQGDLTYFDYKLYLRDMLKENAAGDHKLIDHISKRHRYYLIDEFQDTDPMQAEIFFYLTAESFSEDWKQCKPRPGSLFIVGDPKQSIYRFNNADVASFKNVRSLFSGDNGEVLKLTSNFRSTYSLHRWFNDVFGSHLLSRDSEDQSKYDPIANKDKDDEFETGVFSYTPADKSDDSQEILNIVNTLVNNPDIKLDGGKEVQYKDIMIITDKKKLLNRYVSIFTANHIPFRVEGDIDFNECPALKDLVAVYKAAVYPANNFYVYEVLISRLFDISAETAMVIRSDLKNIRSTGVFVSENDDVKKAVELLNHYHEISGKVTPSALFSELIDDLQIFAVSGNYNLEYVYYVLELLRSKEASGEVTSCENAVSYLERLISKEEKLERCASLEKDDNRIHLANLHKVKGLEAPVVILAGARKGGGNNSPDKRVEFIDGKPHCYMFGVSMTGLRFKNSDKKEREKESVEAERIRQLYVAATRAKRILIVADSKPWTDLSQYINCDFFSKYPYREPVPFVPEEVNGTELYEQTESIIKEDSVSKSSSIEIHKPSYITYETVTEAAETINTKRNPKLIGTLVHKMMEVIVSSGNSVSTDELISSMCSSIDVEDSYYADILHRVNDRIQNGGYPQVNGVNPDILNELLSADEVYCEVPFSYNIGVNSITTGIIDVLYRKGDDWFIIDYKTNADGSALDEKYQSQLNEYCKAFEKQTGMKVIARTYHIDA
ncbi:MAG: UvrD-helicase domain-containing protein [Erysipelotrichaceae bacterium]|nr:UvrD-helicase domain-containing protein [Erysipelotrichaceae bacterium]